MRQQQGTKDAFLIGVSFLLGFILTIVPLPQAVTWYRPSWVLLILLYWLMSQPYRVGIVVAWFIGLLTDLMTGSLLGSHAFVFTLVAHFALKYHPFIRGLSSGSKIVVVLVVEVSTRLIQYLIDSYFHVEANDFRYWLPVLTTLLAWPIVELFLNARQHQRNTVRRAVN